MWEHSLQGVKTIRDRSDIPTPSYILDKVRLDRNIDGLFSAFQGAWGEVVFGYSLKTNSLPWLVCYMKKRGFYAEVVSEQEFRLARVLGFPVSQTIVNGPVKSRRLIKEALTGGAILNVDNQEEIAYIEDLRKSYGGVWQVGLRYNFLLERACPGETLVGEDRSRFGFCVENGEFGLAVERLKRVSDLEIIGLHGHNSTRTKSLAIFSAIAREAARLRQEYGLSLKYFDMGGGFFGDKPGTPSLEDYARTVAEAFGEHREVALIVEPGAGVISSPISYLCQIKNRRKVGDKVFLTTDGSLIHIDPMMHGIDFSKEILRESSKERESKRDYRQELCGFTCIERDRMGVFVGKELDLGDRVLYQNCGSYSMALSPLFIGYFPRVYLKEEEGYRLIREAWDEFDVMRKCEVDT